VLGHIDKQGLGATGFASADYDLLGCTNTGKASGTPVFLCDKALDSQVCKKLDEARKTMTLAENLCLEMKFV
jgi:hypothetical protein